MKQSVDERRNHEGNEKILTKKTQHIKTYEMQQKRGNF